MSAGGGPGPSPTSGAADAAVLDRWWQAFAAAGTVPTELLPVQTRLVRAVHRGALPSGPVFVKTMTFPRLKDRLRYALRPLPAAHEAAMLCHTAAAGIPCPEVVAAWTARRAGLPHRSFLVLRALPVVDGTAAALSGDEPPDARLADEAALAVALLAAGILHRDLHTANFVRCRDGRLAVLDLQSANCSRAARAGARRVRLAVAARLVRDRPRQAQWPEVLLAAGLLRDRSEVDAVATLQRQQAARHRRSRIARCLGNTTEFERRWHWWGTEHRLRAGIGDGRWWHGTGALWRAWLGQRVRQLDAGVPLAFSAYFRKWWWLGGGAALYVPATCSDDRIEAEVRSASAALEQRTHAIAHFGRSGDSGTC